MARAVLWIVLLACLILWWRSRTRADVFGWFRPGWSVVAASGAGRVCFAVVAPVDYEPRTLVTSYRVPGEYPFLHDSLEAATRAADRRWQWGPITVARGTFEPHVATRKGADWFLVVPHWLVAALTGGPGAAALCVRWARRRRVARAVATGRCPVCDYDLRASPGACPECGAAAARHRAPVDAA